ncbi:MAG: HlyD family efflux transporter periplasmic adaptor subunit [Leptolyngbya sp. SIO1E4]|nr:HlyD family efflux transporter periplasmic adaptor subunit [Leptolyngbya sp. SIO1E4]
MGQLQEQTKGKFFRLRLRPEGKTAPADVVKQPRRSLPRWLPYGLAGLGIAILVALAFRPAPIPVDVGEVTEGPLQVTVDAEGKTRVQDRYVVAAPVSGRLQRIGLEAGDPVEAGAVVAQIDPLPLDTQVRAAQARLRELQAELAGVDTQRPKSEELTQAEARLRSTEATQQAAAADVAQTQAALEQARRDRTRAEDLEADGAISRQEREAAELEETRLAQALEAAQQELEGAIADVAAAQEALPLLRAEQRDPDYLVSAYQAQIAGVEAELANLADEAQRTTIVAPVSGSVLRLPEASARFVQAGDPLIELGNPAELELVIDVLSADAVPIEPGDTILVEQWGGPDALTATVSYIEPAAFTEVSALGVEEQRVNVVGAFKDDIADSLGDGFRIDARIVIWADDNTLQVPISALYRCDTDWCVFVVEDGRASPRQVTISRRSTAAAAIESGLQPGEQVILHPSEQIEAGRQVESR